MSSTNINSEIERTNRSWSAFLTAAGASAATLAMMPSGLVGRMAVHRKGSVTWEGMMSHPGPCVAHLKGLKA